MHAEGESLQLDAKTARPSSGTLLRTDGFTLLEVVLVLVVLSMTLLLVVPKFSRVESLPTVSRPLANLIRSIHVSATTTKQTYRLYVDLDRQAYWVRVAAPQGEQLPSDPRLTRRWSLPPSIRIKGASTPAQGSVTSGQAVVSFSPMGRVDRFMLLLADENEEVLSLNIKPLTGEVQIFDREVRIPDRSVVPEAIHPFLLPVRSSVSRSFEGMFSA